MSCPSTFKPMKTVRPSPARSRLTSARYPAMMPLASSAEGTSDAAPPVKYQAAHYPDRYFGFRKAAANLPDRAVLVIGRESWASGL